MRRLLKSGAGWIARENDRQARSSAATKTGQRLLYHRYRESVLAHGPIALRETGFRAFSQFEEDGKLLFIAAALDIPSCGSFIDIGSRDGIDSNCANLAINFSWHGTFIDGDHTNVDRGRAFYGTHPDTWAYPPRFVTAIVTSDNINGILETAGVPTDVDLMSIDIDGNDYWIWDAIDVVNPKVVVIETHVEFGLRPIVVPYDPAYVYPGRHRDYHGASVTAMVKLAAQKGYRLIGSNDYGFNTIYVRNELAVDALPEVTAESVLAHPRNAERAKLFEPIADWEYVEV